MSQHPGHEEWGWSTEKIRPQHVERLAVVYVRQSTMQQVLEHQESTRLQYGLVQRAVAWGWSEARVLVIDDDLGRSGTSGEGRHGFQRLVAEVGLDHVGLILGVEMSRLARSSKDWHQLLEICALFGTLIAALDGKPVERVLNLQVWPRYAARFKETFGFAPEAGPIVVGNG